MRLATAAFGDLHTTAGQAFSNRNGLATATVSAPPTGLRPVSPITPTGLKPVSPITPTGVVPVVSDTNAARAYLDALRRKIG